MTRHYCDRCNKELNSILKIKLFNCYGGIEKEFDLCNTCYKEIDEYLRKVGE